MPHAHRHLIFTKLNLKEQSPIAVLSAPPELAPLFDTLEGVRVLRRAPTKPIELAIAFATTVRELEAATAKLAPKIKGDGILWIAYPKRSSKRYTCEFNRDTGWDGLGAAGFEPVRQVAIDEDWTALRFRRVEHITTMTRTFAMTALGRAKAARGRAPR
jgi:hypothetical protein